MQGLPEGWVTGVPGLSRNAQLKALGNGVVPAQAALALRILLARADAGWLDEHREQSAACRDSLPGPLATTLGCGHD